MGQSLKIGKLDCMYARQSEARIAYVLYPMETLGAWIDDAARRYDVSIVVITGMDWDDDMTPWPAKGVPAGTADFKGDASRFMASLQGTVMPEVEKAIGIHPVERNLIGVSLSGLFTMWQWAMYGIFNNIASLSGSFWYEGFADWFDKNMTVKGGRAFLLLGDREADSRIPQFRSVAAETQRVVARLKEIGIKTEFEHVPGDHFADPVGRLDRAFATLFSPIGGAKVG